MVLFFLTRPNLLLFGRDVTTEKDPSMKVVLLPTKSDDSVEGRAGGDVIRIGRDGERTSIWASDGVGDYDRQYRHSSAV